MALDLNDAPQQREEISIIPDGTYVKVKAALVPGGSNLPGADELDAGLFKQSATSDVIMLNWEFTVLHGPYARRKIFQGMVIDGGQRDDKGVSKGGNITKGMLRAMANSAIGLDPKDMSEHAKARRVFRGYSDFDGIEFAARVGVEKGSEAPDGGKYPDRNRLAHIVMPPDPEWKEIMEGREVPPKPTGATRPRSSASTQSTPVAEWQRQQGTHPQPVVHQVPLWQAGNSSMSVGNNNGAASNPAANGSSAPAGPASATPSTPSGPSWIRR